MGPTPVFCFFSSPLLPPPLPGDHCFRSSAPFLQSTPGGVVAMPSPVAVVTVVAWHKPEIGEFEPVVLHTCFSFVFVCTLWALLLNTFMTLLLAANAICPLLIADVTQERIHLQVLLLLTRTIAVFWFLMLVILYFISQSSTMLYQRCFTSSAKNIGEIVNIFKV